MKLLTGCSILCGRQLAFMDGRVGADSTGAAGALAPALSRAQGLSYLLAPVPICICNDVICMFLTFI